MNRAADTPVSEVRPSTFQMLKWHQCPGSEFCSISEGESSDFLAGLPQWVLAAFRECRVAVWRHWHLHDSTIQHGELGWGSASAFLLHVRTLLRACYRKVDHMQVAKNPSGSQGRQPVMAREAPKPIPSEPFMVEVPEADHQGDFHRPATGGVAKRQGRRVEPWLTWWLPDGPGSFNFPLPFVLPVLLETKPTLRVCRETRYSRPYSKLSVHCAWRIEHNTAWGTSLGSFNPKEHKRSRGFQNAYRNHHS